MASTGNGRVNIIQGTHPELVTFLVLNMWPSHLGLPLLLAVTLLSKRVHRHATFHNLCVVFIFIGLSSSILVYAGAVTGPEPPPILCLFQASLLYGMPALSSTAVFVLVLQMFLVIRSNFYGFELTHSKFRLWVMIVVPYITWMAFILATASVGTLHPDKISRNRRFFYCSVKSDVLTNIITLTAAVVLLATLICEVWTLVLFYKRWKCLAYQDSNRRPLDLNMPVRVLAFGLYVMIAMSLSLLSITSPSSPIPDLVIASAATVVILIFGTQLDILRVLCFWKRPSPDPIRVEKGHITIVPLKDEPPLRWSHQYIPRI